MRRVVSRRFDFQPSRRTRVFVLASHAATIGLVAILPLDVPLAASTTLLVAALGARAWRDAGEGLAGIVVRSDGSVVALRRDGRAVDGALADGGVALPELAAIAWRAEDERRTRHESVAPDRVGVARHRELRVMLRYATSGDEAEAPASQARASMSAALSALGWPARRWR
jgi:hypothetical protein